MLRQQTLQSAKTGKNATSLPAFKTEEDLQLTEELREELTKALLTLWIMPAACKGNDARSMAVVFAMAASEGFITTWTPGGYTSEWRVTAKGLSFLEKELRR